MAYQPPNVYQRPPAPVRRAATMRPPLPPQARVPEFVAARRGFGEFGASAGVAVAQTAVSSIPVVGPLLSNIVGPLASILDPGAKRDAGRKQRLTGIVTLANEGSLLAARQLYGGAEKGAVGAASEKALYVAAWAAFNTAHSDLATAARAAGPAGVGSDPVNGWQPPPADVAQYQAEITAYRSGGIGATALQVGKARTAGYGGTVALVVGLGLAGAFLMRGGRR